MRRQLKRFVLFGISVALALPSPVLLASSGRSVGTCISGNCANGFGTVRDRYNEYTGNWSNSWFTAGKYSALYDWFPNQRFDLVVDAQGFPLEGTACRGSHFYTQYLPTCYTGTFAKVYHPFDKKYVPRYAHGRYTDTSGVVYDGDFDYIPDVSDIINGTNGGHYIFQGIRINEEADQVRPGLYISDWTTSDVVIGEFASSQRIIFRRATPDYIIKLQDDLRKNIQEANAEEAAKLTKERESRENWNSLFTAALGFAAVVGVMQVASRSSGGSSPVSVLGDTLMGKQTSQDAASKMAVELRERAKTDPALVKRIGNATDAELVTMMKQAGSTTPAPMTMADYRSATSKPAQQAHAENTRSNAGVTTIPGGNTVATNVANTEKAKTYLCPQRESFTSSIHYLNAKVETFTFEEACARAQQQASEFVGRLGRNQTGYGNNMKVKNIEACRKTNHDEEAVVHVNMEEPSSSACGTTSGGMAR